MSGSGSGAGKKSNLPARVNPLMPGLRYRHNGFTAERTRIFLATLGQTGCVRDAARVAGVTSTNAYRLKARFPLFSAQWDRAAARARIGLHAIAWQRAVEGKETIIIRGGVEVERRITPDSAMLSLLLKQGDLASGGALADMGDPDRHISWREWQAGIRFTGAGEKVNEDEDTAIVRQGLIDKLNKMRKRIEAGRGFG